MQPALLRPGPRRVGDEVAGHRLGVAGRHHAVEGDVGIGAGGGHERGVGDTPRTQRDPAVAQPNVVVGRLAGPVIARAAGRGSPPPVGHSGHRSVTADTGRSQRTPVGHRRRGRLTAAAGRWAAARVRRRRCARRRGGRGRAACPRAGTRPWRDPQRGLVAGVGAQVEAGQPERDRRPSRRRARRHGSRPPGRGPRGSPGSRPRRSRGARRCRRSGRPAGRRCRVGDGEVGLVASHDRPRRTKKPRPASSV